MMNYAAQIKEDREDLVARELGLRGGYSLRLFCGLKQTEKAVYVMFFTGYSGTVAHRKCKWVPKAWIEDPDAVPMIEEYDDAVNAFRAEFDQ